MKPAHIPALRPRLKVLSRQQALAIHTAALEILEKTGVKMEHPECLEMLAGAGGHVYDKDWIRLPAFLAEEALCSAPRQITLYDQNGHKAMPLVDHNSFYGTGSDTTFTLDLESGQRRRCVLSDTGNFAEFLR